MRNKVLAPLAIIVGLVLLYGGSSSLNDNTVRCGAQTMRSTDTCKVVSRKTHRGTERSLAQQRHSNHEMGWILLGLGGVATIGGAVMAIYAYRPRPKLQPPPQGPPSPSPPGW